jgi:hypothetical protein
MNWLKKIIANWIIKYLTAPSRTRAKKTPQNPKALKKAIRPGDVLLVEGVQRFSSAIKYLTQSNWSHVSLFVGPIEGYDSELQLFEADLETGVRLIPLSEYDEYHTRICRPKNLSPEDLNKVIEYCVSRIGHSYDTKNIFDLAKYLLPLPPVPNRWKRRVLQFGSGDPSKVICSSIITDAFREIDYPILPVIEQTEQKKKKWFKKFKRIPSTLFTPSDFDRSPYFEIIKPTLEEGFDYRNYHWEDSFVSIDELED